MNITFYGVTKRVTKNLEYLCTCNDLICMIKDDVENLFEVFIPNFSNKLSLNTDKKGITLSTSYHMSLEIESCNFERLIII